MTGTRRLAWSSTISATRLRSAIVCAQNSPEHPFGTRPRTPLRDQELDVAGAGRARRARRPDGTA